MFINSCINKLNKLPVLIGESTISRGIYFETWILRSGFKKKKNYFSMTQLIMQIYFIEA